MSRRLRRPSSADVLATLALFVSLGSVSYAAVKLPAGSVGSRELRLGAVTGVDIKDRSLLRADLGVGQAPTGPKGPRGEPGSTLTSPLGGALSGSVATPGLAPDAVTGAAVAADTLAAWDFDQSTLVFDLGSRRRSSGTLTYATQVTLLEDPQAGKLSLSCSSVSGLRAQIAAATSRRILVESTAPGETPRLDTFETAGVTFPVTSRVRVTTFGADGALPVRLEVITAGGTGGCTFNAVTQVG